MIPVIFERLWPNLLLSMVIRVWPYISNSKFCVLGSCFKKIVCEYRNYRILYCYSCNFNMFCPEPRPHILMINWNSLDNSPTSSLSPMFLLESTRFPLYVPSTQNVNLGIHYIQTLIAIPHLHLKRGGQWVMGSRERGRQEATSPFEEKTENPSRRCHRPQTWRFWKMISWYHNWAMIKSVTTSMGSHH